jgi:hypothetical protein
VTALLLAALLQQGAAGAPSYDDLVARAVAAGREGRLEEAARDLDAAVAEDASRPEAWVERGGLYFLQKRYEDAARELRAALAIRDDEYARDLLASSLYLSGHEDEALDQWNRLGKPKVARVEVQGLVHVLDRVARREVVAHEGAVLTVADLRETRLRLHEVGVFDRVTVRATPQADGRADVDVAVLERHGLFASPVDAAVGLGVDALNHFVRLRWSDVGGAGISVGGGYRWQENRPEASLFLSWPRPLGLDANLRFSAFRGRQLYALELPILERGRGFDLGFRRVTGARTVVDAALRVRERTFSRPDVVALPGTVLGGVLGAEHRLLESRRQRLDLSARVLFSRADARYTRGLVGATYRVALEEPDGAAIDRSILAARLQWGGGTRDTPVDDMFAAGGSPEMEYPLRAHPQVVDGALGVEVPLARTLLLGNLEWRRRLFRKSLVQVGVVAFCDAGDLQRTVSGDLDHRFTDVGMGLRVGVGGGSILRLDWGHGLRDGRDAVFVGLGQVF